MGVKEASVDEMLRNVPLQPEDIYSDFFSLTGLLTATVASRIHRAAQPALLYLVPFTLLPLLTMAYLKVRGEDMWAAGSCGPAGSRVSVLALGSSSQEDDVCPWQPWPRTEGLLLSGQSSFQRTEQLRDEFLK